MDKTETRAVIKFLQKKGMTPKEIHADMVQTLAEASPSYATVKKWAAEFRRGRNSTKDDPRSGRPKTSTSDEQVDAIHRMVSDDKCLTVQQIAKSIGISSGSVHTVLTENLGMSKLSARWVPKEDKTPISTGFKKSKMVAGKKTFMKDFDPLCKSSRKQTKFLKKN